jgi:hypothetical protein
MDPVSAVGVAAAALQIAAEAGTVLLVLYRYFVEVKEAGSNAAKLREEIGVAISQLHAISAFLNSQPNSEASEEFADLRIALTRFHGAIETIKERIQPQSVLGFERLKWPFKKQENAELLADVERCKSTFNLALNIGQR